MRDESRLLSYLEHTLQAIERIQDYTEDLDELAFLEEEMTQDAVIRNLEVIGEASRNIEHHLPDFAKDHPNLPLASAYEMRNALAHGPSPVKWVEPSLTGSMERGNLWVQCGCRKRKPSKNKKGLALKFR